MIYEARVTLEDGRTATGTVDAEDGQDAKYEFAHSMFIELDSQQFRIVKVDYRSVRLAERVGSIGKKEKGNVSANY